MSNQELKISVSATETETDNLGLKLYTSYTITIESTLPDYPRQPTSVKRRYNDFCWLYTRLMDEYDLTKNRKDPVPPPAKVPPKKVLGRFSEKFIEKRRRALEAWLVELSNHPVWPTMVAFRLFLTEPNMLGVLRY